MGSQQSLIAGAGESIFNTKIGFLVGGIWEDVYSDKKTENRLRFLACPFKHPLLKGLSYEIDFENVDEN